MAVRLLAHQVSDICLGKPALRSISVSATVGDALLALKRSTEISLSVWSCDHESDSESKSCECIGKVSMVDIICFLCVEDNLLSPFSALRYPISVLIRKDPPLVKHVQSNSSLLEAIDLILDGAQNLVVPIESRITAINYKRKIVHGPSFASTFHRGKEFCWLSQEDVIRYLLNSITRFSPTSALSIQTLSIMETDNLFSIRCQEPASSALPLIEKSVKNQTAVAVVDDHGCLVGEISYLLLAGCDETVSAAIATLSAGELVAFIDGGDPPEELVRLAKSRLEERNLGGFVDLIEEDGFSATSVSCSSSSSDEEYGMLKGFRPSRGLSRRSRRSEAVCCYPENSLIAVMIQALAHRVNYVWVVGEDWNLVGIVTFSGMLRVFREHVRAMG